MKKYILSGILSLMIPLFVLAQNSPEAEELDTDRPNKTQSPKVVPQGTVQLETGLQFEKDEKAGVLVKDYFYPEALVRVSILKWAELRISGEFMQEHTDPAKNDMSKAAWDEIGFNDVQVGAKFTLFKGKGLIPEIGFLGNVTLPVGNEDLRPVHAAPEASLLFGNKLSENLELQYNVGYRKAREQDKNLGESFYSVSGNAKISEKLGYFIEFSAQKPNEQASENTLDTGFMYKLLPYLQVDAITGLGVSEPAPNFFVGAGITWRIPQ